MKCSDKMRIFETWPTPRTLKELRSFTGFCNYYRRYVYNFSSYIAAFGNLLKKGSPFIWTAEHQVAFDELKRLMCQEVKLPFVDMSKECLISTDACDKSISYILSQKDDSGFYRPVIFSGRCLRKAELNYTVTERELLALICATREFRPYIVGHHFNVETDHISLKYLNSMKPQTGRLARWSCELSMLDFTLMHKW